MTSPAICVGQTPFSYDNCKFMFITKNKKLAVNHSPWIVGLLLYEYNDNLERFTHLAEITVEWILSQAPWHTTPHKLAGILIEPPPSSPSAIGHNPAATAAADPLEDPPG